MLSAPLTAIQWGSVADWVSGIGSFAAAAVALYVAQASHRVRLRASCGHRIIIGGGQPRIDVFSVSATNVSQRPTVVTNIGFSFGILRWKRHGLITFMPGDLGPGIPKSLSDGETASWNAKMGPDNKWARDLVEKFNVSKFDLWTWRVQIHLSNGGTTELRPEKGMRRILLTCIKEHGH